MSGVHEVEFEKMRPSLVHLDAPAAFRKDRVVVSYDWANDPDYLVVKLAFIDGSADTLVLRRHVAERLHKLIAQLGNRSWVPSRSAEKPAAPTGPKVTPLPAKAAPRPAPAAPSRKAAAAAAVRAPATKAAPKAPAKPAPKPVHKTAAKAAAKSRPKAARPAARPAAKRQAGKRRR